MSKQFCASPLHEKLNTMTTQLAELEQQRAEKEAMLERTKAQAALLSVEYESCKQKLLIDNKKLEEVLIEGEKIKDLKEAQRLSEKVFHAKLKELSDRANQVLKQVHEKMDKYQSDAKKIIEDSRNREITLLNDMKSLVRQKAEGSLDNEKIETLREESVDINQQNEEDFCDNKIELKKKEVEIFAIGIEMKKINEEREAVSKEYAQKSNKIINELRRIEQVLLLHSFSNSEASLISSANEQPGVAVSSSYSL